VGLTCKSGHRIDAARLMNIVADTLKAISKFAQEDEAAFAQKVGEALSARQTGEIQAQKKQLTKLRKRAAEIETLYKRIYEDNALGKLPDKRFNALSAEYEKEQTEIEKQIPELQAAVDSFEGGNEKAKQFMELVKRYRDFDEMSVSMLNEFVEKIIVHERDKKFRIDPIQKVEVHLNFIGEFSIPQEETETELTAEQLKILERRERMHQNYLIRKENGKQQEWERKYEPIRKARKAETKAALFAEGAVLGANAAAPFVTAAL